MVTIIQILSIVFVVIPVMTEKLDARKKNPKILGLTNRKEKNSLHDGLTHESQNIAIIQPPTQSYNSHLSPDQFENPTNFIDTQLPHDSILNQDNFQDESSNYGAFRQLVSGQSIKTLPAHSITSDNTNDNQLRSLVSQVLTSDAIIPIIRDDRIQKYNGEYNFLYETADGIKRQEIGTQNDGQVVKGVYSYTSPEGVPVEISFEADHNGYQPQGSAIPVSPELPYQRTQEFIH